MGFASETPAQSLRVRLHDVTFSHSQEDAMEAEEEEDGDTEGQTAAEDSAGGATAPEDVMTIDDDSEPEK